MFYKNETLGLVIDGPATHNAGKDADIIIDWKAFHAEFARRGQLLRATYITPVFYDEDNYVQIRPMTDWMEYNGFNLITRRAKEEDGEHGRRIKGGNLHVDFTLEALNFAQRCDHIVLFTGDGSYAPLISELQRMGCRVSVCCAQPITADILQRLADNFIDIAQLREIIGKERSA